MPLRLLLLRWPVVKVVLEAVGHSMAPKARMPVASVVAVLAVGRSPAVSEARVAAAVASVVLASVEPVEYRTVAARCTPCHSFVRSCWRAVVPAAASSAGPRRSGSYCCWCWASRLPWRRSLLLRSASVALVFARPSGSSSGSVDSMLRILAAGTVAASCFHR